MAQSNNGRREGGIPRNGTGSGKENLPPEMKQEDDRDIVSDLQEPCR